VEASETRLATDQLFLKDTRWVREDQVEPGRVSINMAEWSRNRKEAFTRGRPHGSGILSEARSVPLVSFNLPVLALGGADISALGRVGPRCADWRRYGTTCTNSSRFASMTSGWTLPKTGP
jgi:hypothetical protein